MKGLVHFLPVLLLLTFAHAASAQRGEREFKCNESYDNGDRARFCEMREQTVPASGSLSVDGRRNGGVRVP